VVVVKIVLSTTKVQCIFHCISLYKFIHITFCIPADYCVQLSTQRCLCSAGWNLLYVQRHELGTFGHRAFAITSLTSLNSLPCPQTLLKAFVRRALATFWRLPLLVVDVDIVFDCCRLTLRSAFGRTSPTVSSATYLAVTSGKTDTSAGATRRNWLTTIRWFSPEVPSTIGPWFCIIIALSHVSEWV